jgi:hypothetical protein
MDGGGAVGPAVCEPPEGGSGLKEPGGLIEGSTEGRIRDAIEGDGVDVGGDSVSVIEPVPKEREENLEENQILLR